jgi:hypothetical protein
MHPDQGSFEANPPFDNDVISQMEAHMDTLLTTAERRSKYAHTPPTHTHTRTHAHTHTISPTLWGALGQYV